MTDLGQETWVLTGAGGRIGSSLRPELATRVERLRMLDLHEVETDSALQQSLAVDLRGAAATIQAMTGAHGVIHLGGEAGEADFHEILEVNIAGTQHVLEAARQAGARRVVFASSNHATGLYPSGQHLSPDMPVRPDSFYGVSKVAGEALGRMYAEKLGLSVICLRIGSFRDRPHEPRELSTWLSPDDCLRAVLAAMAAPADVVFTTFYAISRNTRRWWDLSAGEAIGFHPQDDAEDYAEEVLAAAGAEDEVRGPQGGPFADPRYTLERQRDATRAHSRR